LEHIPASLESSPAINASNFMHRKMFLPFFCQPKLHLLIFQVKQDIILAACLPKLHLLVLSRCKFGGMIILPAKTTSTQFPSKMSRCNFGGMIILPAKMTSTLFE
jgi:hypothetical protein